MSGAAPLLPSPLESTPPPSLLPLDVAPSLVGVTVVAGPSSLLLLESPAAGPWPPAHALDEPIAIVSKKSDPQRSVDARRA